MYSVISSSIVLSHHPFGHLSIQQFPFNLQEKFGKLSSKVEPNHLSQNEIYKDLEGYYLISAVLECNMLKYIIVTMIHAERFI